MSDDHARALFQQAQELKQQGKAEAAVNLLEEARRMAPNAMGVLAELGLLYGDLGRNDEAIECLEAYISKKPDVPPILFSLGSLVISQGEASRGVELLERAIEIDPGLVPALVAISPAKRTQMEAAHIQILERTLERGDINDDNRCSLCYALGMVNDKPGTEDRAFDFFTRANTYRYEALQDKTDTYITSMKAMRQMFTSELIESIEGSTLNDRLPIFVVGMPRSGTSLVEQIISSHSKAHGAGELKELTSIVKTEISTAFGEPLRQAISKCTPSHFEAVANKYLTALRAYSPTAERIVDKMPHNFIMVGMIRLMLPDATIINWRRNPMDTCWSVFKTPLKSGHPYSFRLEDIAQHYLQYRKLMDHWRTLFPGKVLDVQYVKRKGSCLQADLSLKSLAWSFTRWNALSEQQVSFKYANRSTNHPSVLGSPTPSICPYGLRPSKIWIRAPESG